MLAGRRIVFWIAGCIYFAPWVRALRAPNILSQIHSTYIVLHFTYQMYLNIIARTE